MDVSRLDLNLLVVFHHLLIKKRVSAVAEQLQMSQPAVSNALGRLRSALGDELFLRAQGVMAPTPYALQLADPVAQALDGLQQALNVRAAFDPTTSTRLFTIAMTDIGEVVFLPVLMDSLAVAAPGVRLQVVSVSPTSLKEDMAAGRIDLAMGLLPQLQAGYFQQALFRQKYVCLMRKAHPMAERKKLSKQAFTKAEHVLIVAAGTGHSRMDTELDRLGLQRKIRLTVPHYVALGEVLRRSNLLATVPERFADRTLTAFDLIKRDVPVALHGSAIHQFWHGRLHRDPGHQWLRQHTRELFGDQGLSDAESAV